MLPKRHADGKKLRCSPLQRGQQQRCDREAMPRPTHEAPQENRRGPQKHPVCLCPSQKILPGIPPGIPQNDHLGQASGKASHRMMPAIGRRTLPMDERDDKFPAQRGPGASCAGASPFRVARPPCGATPASSHHHCSRRSARLQEGRAKRSFGRQNAAGFYSSPVSAAKSSSFWLMRVCTSMK